MQYDNVQLMSPIGLNWDLQFSRVNSCDRAAHTLQHLPNLPGISGGLPS